MSYSSWSSEDFERYGERVQDMNLADLTAELQTQLDRMTEYAGTTATYDVSRCYDIVSEHFFERVQ